MYSTLIDVNQLAEHIADEHWQIVDCRFRLDDPRAGERAYLAAHIPGAVYADLDWHLTGVVVPGKTGRHPLPDPERLAMTLGLWGIDARTQVVAYDEVTTGMAAARLWWLLQWLGHQAVAMLDGGWQAWQARDLPTARGPEIRPPRRFQPIQQAWMVVDTQFVESVHCRPDYRLIDARSRERYWGIEEPIDPVAGHIPCAVSLPFSESLTADGYLQPIDELRRRFEEVLGDVPAERTIVYCGSGVTAAHTVLAMTHAGLGTPRLYAGSWSEWITDPARPVARGHEPAAPRA